MSQSFWESEPVEEQQPEVQQAELLAQTEILEQTEFLEPEDPQPEMLGFASEAESADAPAEDSATEESVEFVPEPQPEPEEKAAAPEPVPDSEALPVAKPVPHVPEVLAMTVDDFTALEDRVLRAVNLVKRERLTRIAIEENVAQLEAQLADQRPLIDQLQAEVHALRTERDQVRQRVERLLTQLDALEL
jgi:uncharacterized coiled-coil protein SlyX